MDVIAHHRSFILMKRIYLWAGRRSVAARLSAMTAMRWRARPQSAPQNNVDLQAAGHVFFARSTILNLREPLPNSRPLLRPAAPKVAGAAQTPGRHSRRNLVTASPLPGHAPTLIPRDYFIIRPVKPRRPFP